MAQRHRLSPQAKQDPNHPYAERSSGLRVLGLFDSPVFSGTYPHWRQSAGKAAWLQDPHQTQSRGYQTACEQIGGSYPSASNRPARGADRPAESADSGMGQLLPYGGSQGDLLPLRQSALLHAQAMGDAPTPQQTR